MASTRKLGFWSVVALVTGSQIGSGIFMSPAHLAPYGVFGIMGWIVSGIGAVALSLVFAKLCSWLPKTGGPHAYVLQAFGPSAAFFTGWTYWVISWVSTSVVIITSIGYLLPLLGDLSSPTMICLELALLLSITALNSFGVSTVGNTEFFLTIIKIIPLILVPIAALCCFNSHNFMIDASVAHLSSTQMLSSTMLLTLWGFIGLESATTPAESVENPSLTIPRAVVAGTSAVALLYLVNSIGIMGVIPGSQLMHSTAPFADAVRTITGGNWHLLVSVLASLVCIGALNAWVLTSGQIALGLAQDGFLPAFFSYKNKYDAPYWSLIMSTIGLIPLLILSANKTIGKQVLDAIDVSVTSFLFVYTICCCAFFKLLWQQRKSLRSCIAPIIYGTIALMFCCWIMYHRDLHLLATASLFSLSGIPLYIRFLRKK